MNLFKDKNYNKLTSWSSVEMKADKTAELNISGYIGIPEWWQFDPEMEKEMISTKEKMQAELKALSNLKVDKIKVNVDSLGGDVNHGQAMFTALSKNSAEIEIEYVGFSASIATIFGAAATDNNVSMSNTNMILIHKARGCQCGLADDMRAYADHLDKINNTISDVYVKQTGKSKEDVLKLMSVNNGEGEWLTANEAQEFGLIKTINEPLAAAANYDLNRLKEFGYKIPQNKLNSINMKFGKEPINALAMQEDGIILLHEGELKEGTVLQKAGEKDAELKGELVTADGRKITIGEKNKVTSIEDAPIVEATTEDDENGVVDQVAELLVEFEAKMDKKIEELRKSGSKAVVPQTNLTSQDPTKIGDQLGAKANVRARMDKIQEKKRAIQDK